MLRILAENSPALKRYALAVLGPVMSAASQFALQLVMLRMLTTAGFGRFSMLMIFAQLSWGVAGALLCAPLPQLLSIERAAVTAPVLRAIFAANVLSAVFMLPLFLAIGVLLGSSLIEAALFAAFAMLALLRWFARSYAYAAGRPLRTTTSDLVYSAAVLAGTVAIWFAAAAPFAMSGVVLFAASAIGMVPFGADLLKHQFGALSLAQLPAYRAIWRQHSRWALLGVVTTEMTANAHAYLIALWFGAGAFAPVAASALLIRPATVAMNALTEFERASLAREIGRGRVDLAMSAVRFGRVALAAAWLVTAIAVAALLIVSPGLLFPHHYALPLLVTGALLWLVVAGVRMARVPDSALLQAAGEFRALAFASVWSSLLSVAAVIALLATVGTIWSILGILVGEIAYAVAIWRTVWRWSAATEAPTCPA